MLCDTAAVKDACALILQITGESYRGVKARKLPGKTKRSVRILA
jgi:hypothetical protein